MLTLESQPWSIAQAAQSTAAAAVAACRQVVLLIQIQTHCNADRHVLTFGVSIMVRDIHCPGTIS
jgi:hypothetical protein